MKEAAEALRKLMSWESAGREGFPSIRVIVVTSILSKVVDLRLPWRRKE